MEEQGLDSKFTCSESGAPCPTVLRLSAKHKLPSPNLTWLVCVCVCVGGQAGEKGRCRPVSPCFPDPIDRAGRAGQRVS